MTLAQLEALDTPVSHAVLIDGRLAWLPEQEPEPELEASDLIDIDDYMLAGLPETDYQPSGAGSEYGLVQCDF